MKILNTSIPGLGPGKTNTDFPVLLPFKGQASGQTGDLRFSRWMVSASPMVMMMIAVLALLIPSVAAAQSKFNLADAFEVLWRWLPFIVGSGFVMNLLISFFTMAIGTAAGVLLVWDRSP
ncbi:MAG: hypothetical protein ACJ0DH_05425 [bacterium]